MTYVIKTAEDNPDATSVVGVGVVPARGVGGQPLEKFAATCPEFQTVGGIPLEGDELVKAATRFAEQRGLEVVEVDADADTLARENGAYVDVPAEQISREQYDATFGDIPEMMREVVEGDMSPREALVAQAERIAKADEESQEGDVRAPSETTVSAQPAETPAQKRARVKAEAEEAAKAAEADAAKSNDSEGGDS